MRRQYAQNPQSNSGFPEEDIIGDDDFARILTELAGRGTIVVEEENDPDFHPDEGENEDEEDEDEDEDGEDLDEMEDAFDDEEDELMGAERGKWHDVVKEPKPEGLSLLYSGEFGRIRHQTKSRTKSTNVARSLLNRGTKLRPTTREDLCTVRLALNVFIASHAYFRAGSHT